MKGASVTYVTTQGPTYNNWLGEHTYEHHANADNAYFLVI